MTARTNVTIAAVARILKQHGVSRAAQPQRVKPQVAAARKLALMTSSPRGIAADVAEILDEALAVPKKKPRPANADDSKSMERIRKLMVKAFELLVSIRPSAAAAADAIEASVKAVDDEMRRPEGVDLAQVAEESIEKPVADSQRGPTDWGRRYAVEQLYDYLHPWMTPAAQGQALIADLWLLLERKPRDKHPADTRKKLLAAIRDSDWKTAVAKHERKKKLAAMHEAAGHKQRRLLSARRPGFRCLRPCDEDPAR